MSEETRDLVIVANRLPVRRSGGKGGGWQISPGGLVSALVPLLESRHGTWVGWDGKSGGRTIAPFRFEGFDIHPLRIGREDLESFYDGFSNRTLWPLYHDAVRWPEYHRVWWGPYRDVNGRFTDVAARVARKNGVVWVHDYHLQLVPAMLRAKRPDVRIGFFLHVPFPPQELFAQLPWRREILEGLLGADVVGFQTPHGALNFARLAVRYAGARRRGNALVWQGRRVKVGTFPVSIDFHRYEDIALRPEVRERAQRIREKLGPHRKIILGVDRLDYTKGIDLRLRAYGELLDRGEILPDECVFVQTAVPSREKVITYAELKHRVEMMVGHINGAHGEIGRAAILYLYRNLPIEELAAFYLAADAMVVTPFRDGMNLVAKEYVATRTDESGVLVLSEFTGAANELKSALLVNPHDVDGVAASLVRAIRMPRREQVRRMRKLRAAVSGHDVFDWGRSFLEALEA